MAGKPKDRRGQRYGRLVVEHLSDRRNSKSGVVYWWCRCDCGNTREVASESLSYVERKKKKVTECLKCARKLQGATPEQQLAREEARREASKRARTKLGETVPEEWLLLPLTVSHAKELGNASFFNGLPCPKGHLLPRATGSRSCTRCKAEETAVRRNTPEGQRKVRERSKQLWADPERRRKAQEKRAAWAATPEGEAKLKAAYKRFYDNNRDRVVKAKTERTLVRYKEDPVFRLVKNLRRRVGLALTNQKTTKDETTLKLVGCTVAELVTHLECQFKEGQSWENYGEWHVDHVRPCASYDLSDPEQRKSCFNWKNLQPLWGEENLAKRDRWEPEEERPAEVETPVF